MSTEKSYKLGIELRRTPLKSEFVQWPFQKIQVNLRYCTIVSGGPSHILGAYSPYIGLKLHLPSGIPRASKMQVSNSGGAGGAGGTGTAWQSFKWFITI